MVKRTDNDAELIDQYAQQMNISAAQARIFHDVTKQAAHEIDKACRAVCEAAIKLDPCYPRHMIACAIAMMGGVAVVTDAICEILAADNPQQVPLVRALIGQYMQAHLDLVMPPEPQPKKPGLINGTAH